MLLFSFGVWIINNFDKSRSKLVDNMQQLDFFINRNINKEVKLKQKQFLELKGNSKHLKFEII